MSIAAIGSCLAGRSRWERAALFVWAGILLFVSVRSFFRPTANTVYPIYSVSGRFWWAGAEVYEPHRAKDVPDGYRYSPAFTVLFAAFATMPDDLGGVIWRLGNAAALLGGLWWFGRAVMPRPWSVKTFAVLCLLIIPLSLESLNNGQANLLVAGCMLATLAAVKEQRWTLAAAFMAIAFACKVYPLALGLVLLALYPRRLGWRLALALGASLAAPFLFQHPLYVSDQYRKWLALLGADDRANIPVEHMYRDLWLLFHAHGLPISRSAYRVMQVAGGVGVALLCCYRQRAGRNETAVLTSVLAWTTAWMMLLGPATETSSFTLLAPALAWSILDATQASERQRRYGLLWLSCLIFALAFASGGFRFTIPFREWGAHVWATLFYVAYLMTEPRPCEAQESRTPATRRAAA